MTPTRWLPLIGFAAVGLSAGWVAVLIVERMSGRVLLVPWIAPAALWLLAVAVLIWALVSRPALLDPDEERTRRRGPVPATVSTAPVPRPPRRRMPPLVAARTAALAMAASRTGAAIGGLYLGIALALLPRLSAPTGSTSFTSAVLSFLACAVLTGAALWLESMCRLRDGDD